MATLLNESCPLCETAAEYCWVDSRNRKYFKCPKCTFFQISTRAQKVLATTSAERRKRYAEQAPKAPADHLLVIRMPDAERRAGSTDILQASYVSKADLPLNCE